MSRAPAATALVYSTEGGRMCPHCRAPLAGCRCREIAAAAARAAGDGVVRVGRESKGRGGKAVTLVRGLPLAGAELEALARQLRSACGAGGTVKDGTVEVQGDHRDRVVAWLAQQRPDWVVKRVG
ncbi:MAG: translation initiation factor Sui1 [Burkholderiales bacterium]|nr:translation initiation factor Sui1 [Burkholderiales bacterium]MDE1928428.1 translation initiation factor Sui1 [Burkholderiales bacterium]MDE2160360.1 translation initiation factor Sui1 [Burkholderiales bacterium]MDE2503182.1 translation initiation factor Sui1 [Burkholderiales bacterium]